MSNPISPQWYLTIQGQVHGPYSEAQVQAGLTQGKLEPQTLACPAGQQTWNELRQWPAFASPIPPQKPIPPSPPPHNINRPPQQSEPPTNGNYPPEILALARAHQRFTIGIGVILSVLVFGMNALYSVLGMPGIIVISLLIAGAQFYLATELTRALNTANAWIWLAVSLLPILGVIGIGFLSNQASSRLKAAGIPVGFLGPKLPRF